MIPAAIADRIAAEVLTRRYLASCEVVATGADPTPYLVRRCACQGGTCGNCQAGRHGQCTTRVGFHGVRNPQPATYLLDRDGYVVAAVWPAGRPCAWRCPCADCLAAVRLDQPVQLDLLTIGAAA